ncbi:MAG: hypothetical protein OHK0022_51840 [Roseiflexaceae bacterium]
MSIEHTITVEFFVQEPYRATNQLGAPLTLDPYAPGGMASPVELLLLSLVACAGQEVLTLLRQEGQAVVALEVQVHAKHRDQYPLILSTIALDFAVTGEEIDSEAVSRSIELVSLRYCPIWSMLEQSAWITASYRVQEALTLAVPGD